MKSRETFTRLRYATCVQFNGKKYERFALVRGVIHKQTTNNSTFFDWNAMMMCWFVRLRVGNCKTAHNFSFLFFFINAQSCIAYFPSQFTRSEQSFHLEITFDDRKPSMKWINIVVDHFSRRCRSLFKEKIWKLSPKDDFLSSLIVIRVCIINLIKCREVCGRKIFTLIIFPWWKIVLAASTSNLAWL